MPIQVKEGRFALESRFDGIEHDYMGAENGYRRLLEINDPERGQKFIIHEMGFDQHGSMHNFSEWQTLEDAKAAFGIYPRHDLAGCKTRKGFVRYAGGQFYRQQPWFYAKGHQVVKGDWIVTVICDGCSVNPQFEHRCHGVRPDIERIKVRGEWVPCPCGCEECNELESVTA